MARYHINPATGKPGRCNPEVTGVCKYGESAEHFSSEADAMKAFENSMNGETFSVVISKRDAETRTVRSFDATLSANITRFEGEFAETPDKAEWIATKVDALSLSQRALNLTAPGSPERKAALTARTAAREELLAADLVVWRNSEFYNSAVEARMKEATVAVADADSSLEQALADEDGKKAVAQQYGISTRDVENILEVTHEDYLRPRSPLSASLDSLSANQDYTTNTAYVFRVEPAAVRGVLSYASQYSTAPSKPALDFAALLD